jgi:hypothetical protein
MFAAWTAANREKVLAHYGQWCACCKSTERLQIDHIAGNGREHRKELGKPGGTSFYQWLIKNDYPEGFQTLCLRCNLSKGTGERCRLNHSGKPLEMHGLAWRRVREGADAAKRDQVKDREVRYALPGQGPAGAE